MARKKKINSRYIDANLVKDALLGWETDPTDEEIEYAIDNIPTADVVEVKHGHWIYDSKEECYTCSECGMSALNDYKGVSIASKGCPHCVALMDGEIVYD